MNWCWPRTNTFPDRGTYGNAFDWGVKVVRQLAIYTNKRTFGPWGNPTPEDGSAGTGFYLTPPAGYEIVGFFGRRICWWTKLGAFAGPASAACVSCR